MKVDREHGMRLSATLSGRGAVVIETAGKIFDAAYHRTELPLNGFALLRAEEAAQDVIAAIRLYREVTAPVDPVIERPRPAWYQQATGQSPWPVIVPVPTLMEDDGGDVA